MSVELDDNQYRNFIESIPHGILGIDISGKIIFANSVYKNIIGYNENELIGKPVCELFIPDSEQETVHNYITMLMKDQQTLIPWTGKNLTKDKRGIDVRVEWNYRLDKQRNISGLIAAVTNVTVEKQVEEALHQRSSDLELLNSAVQSLSSTLNLDKILTTVLKEVKNLLGIAASSIWLIDPETKEVVCRHTSGPRENLILGWRLKPGEGIAGWVSTHGKSLNVPDTRVDKRHHMELDKKTGILMNSIVSAPLKVNGYIFGTLQLVDTRIGFFNDTHLKLLEPLAVSTAIAIENARLFNESLKEITERKKAEEQLRASLKEKEILIDEIHHRAKNNLQIISSILDMNSLRTNDKNVIQLFSNTIEKINTMALLYNQLYQDKNIGSINMRSHIINVMNYLKQIYKEKQDLAVRISVDPVIYLTLSRGIPLTLVLTELTTNAFKHAFKKKNNGIIEIFLHKKDNNLLSLKVKDNGAGIPDHIDFNSKKTLGLRLTRNIVMDQLNGSFIYEKNNGAEFTIEFNALEGE